LASRRVVGVLRILKVTESTNFNILQRFKEAQGEIMSTLTVIGVAIVAAWLWSGLKKLPYGWRGRLLFLGKKTGIEVGQGWVCVPWPLEVKAADCKKAVVKLDGLEAKTKDNVTVKVDASFVKQIVDLGAYFSVDPKTVAQGLDDARDQEIRHRIRQVDLEVALDLQVDLAKEAEDAMGKKTAEWGIEISQLFIAAIKADAEVDEALELKKREELEREGQRVQARHHAELFKFFSGSAQLGNDGPTGPSLPPDQANEAALIHMDKTDKKKLSSNTFGLDKATIDAIVSAVRGETNV
jgi:regulator of protease activity HflC (stomatin/prohibitin superfamily)